MTTSQSEQARINQIRKALAKDAIRLESFLEQGYPAVALHSNSTLIDVNAPAEAMFGYGHGEMDYLNAWTLFPPESAPALMQHLVSHSEEPYQVIAKRKDGSTFMVEIKGKEFMLRKEPIRAVLLRIVEG